MEYNISENIKFYRTKMGITQEKLAAAIGISAQAVSKWERGDGYPDIAMLPPLANFFGVSIDMLFGYQGERNRKINEILAEADSLAQADKMAQDVHLDRRIELLRDGLIEFPRNERLIMKLADTLTQAGYTKLGYASVVEDGQYVANTAHNSSNPYWQEAIMLYELIAETSEDAETVHQAKNDLIYRYGAVGEYEKASKLVESLPPIGESREIMRISAVKGAAKEIAIGEALLVVTGLLSNLLIDALVQKPENFDGELPIQTIERAMHLFRMVIPDENYGIYHAQIALLRLYLSEHLWLVGRKDEAFEELDLALEHARRYDELITAGKAEKYTAPFLDGVSMRLSTFTAWDGNMARTLPATWPFWLRPNCRDVADEMKADPRWDAWVRRTIE